MRRNIHTRRLWWLAAFSIAMGFLESAVVVYLRALYYPDGFLFPLVPMESSLAITEVWREVCTIVMLFAVGFMVTKNWFGRIAAFIFCFGVWDVFYYVFLKLLIDWPPSLLTWDILFLIPMPWVGPVLAPVLVALLMIVLGGYIVYRGDAVRRVRTSMIWWLALFVANFIMLFTMMEDYIYYMLQGKRGSAIWDIGVMMFADLSAYIPTHFNWPLFALGYALAIAFIAKFINQLRNVR